MPSTIRNGVLFVATLLLSSGCSADPSADKSSAANGNFAWPASLVTVGDGYPTSGALCRRIGESAATSDYLDDSATLVGCPGARDSAAVKAITNIAGRVVGEVDGVTLIAVPSAAPGPAMAKPEDATSDEGGGALVAGTNFNATGTVPCARHDGQPTSECRFGVVRAGDGSATVTIFWPGGGSRAIFFDTAGKPTGFDANQADGSAKARLVAKRHSDLNLITIGAERYEIPDVVVAGD